MDNKCNQYQQDTYAWNVNAGTIELTDDIVCNQADHGLFHARAGDVLTIIGNGHMIDLSGCADGTKCRAISLHNGAIFEASNVTIKGGQAPTGGGLWVGDGASLSLSHVTFVDNHAYRTNANNGRGGAIWIQDRSDTIDLSTVRFQDNTADSVGPAVYTTSSVIIDDCDALREYGAFEGTIQHPACTWTGTPTQSPTEATTASVDESSFPFDVSLRQNSCPPEWTLVDDILCYGVVQTDYLQRLQGSNTQSFVALLDGESMKKTCPIYDRQKYDKSSCPMPNSCSGTRPEMEAAPLFQAETSCYNALLSSWTNRASTPNTAFEDRLVNCMPHELWYTDTFEANPPHYHWWFNEQTPTNFGTPTFGWGAPWISYRTHPHIIGRMSDGQNSVTTPSSTHLCQKTGCSPGSVLEYDINTLTIDSVSDVVAVCRPCAVNTTTNKWGARVCEHCVAGFNCSSDANWGYTRDCLAGTYCAEAESGYCNAGYYCPLGSTTKQGEGVCDAGYYCPAGSATKQGDGMCDTGYYCPAGSATKQGDGMCEAGYYCPAGSATKQGVGVCDAGYYCPAGSATNTTLCKGGYYCPNSSTEVVCETGYHCPAGSSTSQGDGMCEAGSYCPAGTPKGVCEAGYYCPAGSTTDRGDGKCEAGYYCPAGSSTDRGDGKCEAGYYCPAGSSTIQGDGRCDVGYYCPAGSSTTMGLGLTEDLLAAPTQCTVNVTEPTTCGDGTFFNPTTHTCDVNTTLVCGDGLIWGGDDTCSVNGDAVCGGDVLWDGGSCNLTCGEDMYRKQTECLRWTKCTSSEYEYAAPTRTTDRVCKTPKDCADTEYESHAPTATADRVCQRLTVCNATEYETVEPVPGHTDRVCQSLTVCTDNETEYSQPTLNTDRVCANIEHSCDVDICFGTAPQLGMEENARCDGTKVQWAHHDKNTGMVYNFGTDTDNINIRFPMNASISFYGMEEWEKILYNPYFDYPCDQESCDFNLGEVIRSNHCKRYDQQYNRWLCSGGQTKGRGNCAIGYLAGYPNCDQFAWTHLTRTYYVACHY